MRILVTNFVPCCNFNVNFRCAAAHEGHEHCETSIAFFSDSPLTEMNHFCSQRLIYEHVYFNCYMNMKHWTDSVFFRTLSCLSIYSSRIVDTGLTTSLTTSSRNNRYRNFGAVYLGNEARYRDGSKGQPIGKRP